MPFNSIIGGGMWRAKSHGWVDGFALGAFAGIEFTLASLWALEIIPEGMEANALAFGASGLTLLAAFIAFGGTIRSIESTQEIASKERNDRLEAARATLPLVVSSIYSICENRIQYLIDSDHSRKAHRWDIPPENISTLKENIELTDGVVRETLKELIAAYQICLARFDDIEVTVHLEKANRWESYDRAGALLDWITLQALCESLFDFSRSRSNTVERFSVSERSRKHIDYLHDRSGWAATNNTEVKEVFGRRSSDDDFGFANPDWKM